MSVGVRITGFAVLLAAVFAIAAVAGAELDPTVDENADAHEEESAEMNAHATTASPALPGLAAAQAGYRFVPEHSELQRDAAATYRFRIVDDSGETVHDFELEHERRMHLIVIRRDFAGFQHLHPRQLDDGSWAAEVDLGQGGVYRVFADFATADASLTLASDLFVAGEFAPQPLPAPARSDAAGDGYEVTLDSGPAIGGTTTDVRFTVTRDGRKVDAVQPYLGADGHLVALREHDQAFLHTHPEGEPGGPGPITFGVEYPTPGRYRLFLQFRHRDEVRTVAFTQIARRSAAGEEATDGDH